MGADLDELKRATGEKLRAARLRAGLTQEALAAAVGLTPVSVSHIERGRHLPTIRTLADLGAVLKIPFGAWTPTARSTPALTTRDELETKLLLAVRSIGDNDLQATIDFVDRFISK